MSVAYKGINMSGLEFGGTAGKAGYQYVVPGKAQYDYWGGNVGANVVRIPFRWERIQHEENGELDKQYLSYVKAQVASAQANGMTAILDLHNYASYRGEKLGSENGPGADALSDVWIKISKEFSNTPNVWLNMMNEPSGISAQKWADISQEVVYDLRAAGVENKILVSGNSWSGAHSWMKAGGNGAVFKNFDDPLDNYAFDVHQYFDKDSSGTSGKIVENSANRLIAITKWAEETGQKLFLGEFGASDPTLSGQQFAQSELTKAINYMDAHSDAWIGWSIWGAGPWWPEKYHYEINPTNIGKANVTDDSIMAYLRPLFERDSTGPRNDEPLLLRSEDLTAYAGNQDGKGEATVSADSESVTLKGNVWKKVELDYKITDDTVLSFDFKSTKQGEIQGIGLDTDSKYETGPLRNFQLYGTQAHGKFDSTFDYTAKGEWQHFDIRVGDLASGGAIKYLTFFNDDDRKNASSDSAFRNIQVKEAGSQVTAETFIGTAGKDRFELDTSSLKAASHVRGFSLKNLDVLDLSDLLEGANPVQNAIDKFIRVTQTGNDSVVSIDKSGSGTHFVKVATLYDATGMTDEAAMVKKGVFDIA